ncbi:MAG: hypothetical protein NTX86_01250 [Candidatus Dependentiae bacterium]|nr:hypothetical protein [Candidatus Dependentiae bacterium]
MLKNSYRLTLLVLFFFISFGMLADIKTGQNGKTDLIIFSYNRPLQLHALLESLTIFVSNLNEIYVLYRVNNEQFDHAYEEIKAIFPRINFVKQGNNPRNDFKPLLLQCFFASPAAYILFAVDDDIVKDYVDMRTCTEALEATNAYCFFLRLGKNIVKQYGQNISLTLPPCVEVKKNIFNYYIKNGIGDWRYPNNVDMTVYKKSTVAPFFQNANYHSPNTLEAMWAAQQNLNTYGLFFETSKMFALPINIIQEDWYTTHENSFTAQELLHLWQDGYAMNLAPFHNLNNPCAFVAIPPTFIKR